MKFKRIIALLSLFPMIFTSFIYYNKRPILIENLVKNWYKINEFGYKSKQKRYENLEKRAKLENDKRLEEERLKKLEEERKLMEIIEEQRKLINKLGYLPTKVKEVTFHITYYYAADNSLQGGLYDKCGKLLKSHESPICALPKDVPYGTKVEFDTPVRGVTIMTNVDTGGAIKWISSNEVKLDFFVKEANSYNWIINNTKNVKVTGRIYYK